MKKVLFFLCLSFYAQATIDTSLWSVFSEKSTKDSIIKFFKDREKYNHTLKAMDFSATNLEKDDYKEIANYIKDDQSNVFKTLKYIELSGLNDKIDADVLAPLFEILCERVGRGRYNAPFIIVRGYDDELLLEFFDKLIKSMRIVQESRAHKFTKQYMCHRLKYIVFLSQRQLIGLHDKKVDISS
jgi:hypothetical protein